MSILWEGMWNISLVGNTGHFDEIDFASSKGLEGMKVINIKPLNTVYRRSSMRWWKIALSCSP